MVSRIVSFALVLVTVLGASSRAQQAFDPGISLGQSASETSAPVESAWIDLRQIAAANSKAQSAPSWVEAVTLGPGAASDSQIATKSIFRIRVSRPKKELNSLVFRLFFDDNPKAHPEIVAWDESGTQVIRSGALGAGLNFPTSETVVIPMINVTALDVEVPGDGSTIRGAYIDWMTSSEVVHPLHAEHRDIMPEPFGASPPLLPVETDTELFGTVIAPLATETVQMGPSFQQSAPFQFGLEAKP